MNKKRLDHDYAIGQKVLILKDGMLCKAEDRYTGPWTITQVHCNGTVRIQHGTVSERLNIRRIPFFCVKRLYVWPRGQKLEIIVH